MRHAPRALLAAVLGFAAAVLVACGGTAGLIDSGHAGGLQGALDQAGQAVSAGDCPGAVSAIRTYGREVANLPSTVSRTIRSSLSGAEPALGQQVRRDCTTAQTTTTATNTTTTGTATTNTVPTTTTGAITTPTSTVTTPVTTPTDTTPTETNTTPTGTSTSGGQTGGAGLGGTGTSGGAGTTTPGAGGASPGSGGAPSGNQNGQ